MIEESLVSRQGTAGATISCKSALTISLRIIQTKSGVGDGGQSWPKGPLIDLSRSGSSKLPAIL